MVGQSLGEAAAAYFAGGLSLADATRTICSRSHLMGEGEAMLFGEYIRLMALVEYSADEIKTVFSDYPDLEVCVYAAPTQTVIGGPPEQVDAIIERAEKEGKFARKFQTKGASHTQQMDPLLGELAAELQGIEPRPLTTVYFSTVHEGSYIRPGGEPIHDVDYWKKGLRHSVYFTHGIRNAVDNGHTTFLELAPNPVALMQVGLTTVAAGLPDAQLIPTLARKQDEVDSMTVAMAKLFVNGHDLDFRTLFTRANGPGAYADIPPTKFRRKPHWLDAHFTGDSSVMMPGNHVATPDGRHVWEYAPEGRNRSGRAGESRCRTGASGRHLTSFEQRALPGEGSRLVTTLARHPGGAAVQVHARIDESFTLVYDAILTRSGHASTLPTAAAAGAAVAQPATQLVPAQVVESEAVADAAILDDHLTQGANLGAAFAKWSPDSGESVGDRLASIVGGASVTSRGSPLGGAPHRTRPGLTDGGADQEPGRVRLRPAAHPVAGGTRRQPLQRREPHQLRDADRVTDELLDVVEVRVAHRLQLDGRQVEVVLDPVLDPHRHQRVQAQLDQRHLPRQVLGLVAHGAADDGGQPVPDGLTRVRRPLRKARTEIGALGQVVVEDRGVGLLRTRRPGAGTSWVAGCATAAPAAAAVGSADAWPDG